MDEARYFLLVCSDRTRHNGLKFEHRKFHTVMQKNFTVRVTEHWNRLPRDVVDAPSLHTFKVRLNQTLGNVIELCMSLFTAGELD